MRIMIFHGYLLGGTGSNVYTARLVQALVDGGHEVHLLSQDRHAEQQKFVGAVADWDSGQLRRRVVRPGLACTAYRPAIGDLLPVYVADRYEGIQARTFAECSDEQIAHYLTANVAAVAEVAERSGAQLALANHLVMGPVILARALGRRVPYAVKIHGSALEYTVRPQMERFGEHAREGLRPARAILVGSAHTAHSLWQAFPDQQLQARTRLGPPGVDIERFKPLGAQAPARSRAKAELLERLTVAARQPQTGQGSFARSPAAAGEALAGIDPQSRQLVAFVGKLLHGKGADLAIAAWPLVLDRHPRAQLLLVGFGSYEQRLRELISGLASGELSAAGRDTPQLPLSLLRAALSGLEGPRRARYIRAAAALPQSVTFTGRLTHEELAPLLGLCSAVLVPSTFPEAFGMIAAEAAACAALPISAEHSGLAELSRTLAAPLPAQTRELLAFELDRHVLEAISGHLCEWFECPPKIRSQTQAALVETVAERYSWQGVARSVLAAAAGELDLLALIPDAA